MVKLAQWHIEGPTKKFEKIMKREKLPNFWKWMQDNKEQNLEKLKKFPSPKQKAIQLRYYSEYPEKVCDIAKRLNISDSTASSWITSTIKELRGESKKKVKLMLIHNYAWVRTHQDYVESYINEHCDDNLFRMFWMRYGPHPFSIKHIAQLTHAADQTVSNKLLKLVDKIRESYESQRSIIEES